MRTTVTLDVDVERLIHCMMAERGISFRQALNEAVRNGLRTNEQPGKFVQKTFQMGNAQEFRWDKAMAVADAIDDEQLRRKGRV
jgi:hypothetical protein